MIFLVIFGGQKLKKSDPIFVNFGSRWVLSEFKMCILAIFWPKIHILKDNVGLISSTFDLEISAKNGPKNAHAEFGDDPSRPKIEK